MSENGNGRGISVVFGSGPLGQAVLRDLLRRGRTVRLVNRRGSAQVPAGVEVARGDVTDPRSVQALARDAAVVYLCAQPPYTEWPAMFPAIMDGAIKGVAATGAKLIFGDNLYMYGPVDGPIHEALPYAATGRKGRVRAQIANMLLQAHQDGRLQAAIGRSSDFYGPHVLASAMGERVFAAALAGKPVELIGNPDMPHSYMYIDDFGRGLVTLGEREEALGKVWHLPSAPALTTRRFVQLVCAAAGAPVRLRVMPGMVLAALGRFVPVLRELKEMLYEFEAPFIVEAGNFERVFGAAEVTPHEEGIKHTLDWYREHFGLTSTERQMTHLATVGK